MTIFLQYFKISAQGAVKAINPPSSRTIGRRLYATLWAALLVYGSNAIAAEYSIQPSITTLGSYNDNVGLSSTSEEELSGLQIKPRLVWKYDNQRTLINLTTDASFDRFNLTQYDTDDQSAQLFMQHRTERGSISLNGGSRHTSARTLEDLDTDIGSRENRATRAEAHNLAFSAQYNLTERNVLQGSVSGSTRNYRSENTNGYDYFSANGLWQHVLNERLRLQTQASYSRYIPDHQDGFDFTNDVLDLAESQGVTGSDLDGVLLDCINNLGTAPIPLISTGIPNNLPSNPRAFCFDEMDFETEQNTVNIQAGFVYIFSEKLSLDVLAGGSETGSEHDSISIEKRSTVVARSKVHSSTFDVSITYNDERLTSTLTGNRANEPTSEGTLRLSNRYEFRNQWKASEHANVYFDLIWFEREASSARNNDQQNFIGRAEYRQRVTEHWTVGVKYQYRQESVDATSQDAQRNSVFLKLTWQPNRLSWSR